MREKGLCNCDQALALAEALRESLRWADSSDLKRKVRLVKIKQIARESLRTYTKLKPT